MPRRFGTDPCRAGRNVRYHRKTFVALRGGYALSGTPFTFDSCAAAMVRRMQHEKRRLEEVYREISEWEITEESGDAGSVGPAETVDAEQLDAYLKSVEKET